MADGSAALDLTGVVAASVTPFKENEALDLERLESHLDFLVDGGCSAILVLGGAGEYVNLSRGEREEVIKAAVAAVDGRVPVIVGALSPSTREVLEMAEFSARAGADALLALPPYYIRTSASGIVEHFRQLAGGAGKNAYDGGAGNDTINARNRVKETVNCGSGKRDVATVDRADKTRGCEKVKRR